MFNSTGNIFDGIGNSSVFTFFEVRWCTITLFQFKYIDANFKMDYASKIFVAFFPTLKLNKKTDNSDRFLGVASIISSAI